jgi:anti-sigma factor RsiW
MDAKNFELTGELIQRYYDGELDDILAAKVAQALEGDTESAAMLHEFRQVGDLLRVSAERFEPDQLAARRTWNAVAVELQQARPRGRVRRHAPWLGAAVAAAAIILYLSPLNIVPPAVADNAVEIESIDCNYASFMVLQPEEDDGHTIIWINEPADDTAGD